jgi:N-acetylglucosaminyldiphosphoundecaprenol N-acetyl-beta-D-mannosaminyltransferase
MKQYNFKNIILKSPDKINTLFDNSIKNKKKLNLSFLNPHSLVVATYDNFFFKSLLKSYNLIDGIGLLLFFYLTKSKLLNRLTGYKVFLISIKFFNDKKFFFLGSNSFICKKIKQRLIKEYSFKKKNISFFSPSYSDVFSIIENEKIIKKINEFKPNFLCIGMTAPKQEKWLAKNSHRLFYNVSMPIGAVFDYFAKKINPRIYSIFGVEWLYRFIASPIKMWLRLFTSFPLFLYICLKNKPFNYKVINIPIVKNINLFINQKSAFILSAFNLAFYSYWYSRKIKYHKEIYTWPDGIFLKLFRRDLKKIPGRVLMDNLILGKGYSNITVIGNITNKEKIYLRKKFRLPIKYYQIPHLSISSLTKLPINIKLPKNSLALITLPTPKQEIIARKLFFLNGHAKIICIGGALRIINKLEIKCPILLEKIGMEFIWRLRYETKRRTIRLIETLYIFLHSVFKMPFIKLYPYRYD